VTEQENVLLLMNAVISSAQTQKVTCIVLMITQNVAQSHSCGAKDYGDVLNIKYVTHLSHLLPLLFQMITAHALLTRLTILLLSIHQLIQRSQMNLLLILKNQMTLMYHL